MPPRDLRERLDALKPELGAHPELAEHLAAHGGLTQLGTRVAAFRAALSGSDRLPPDGARAFADGLAAQPSFGDSAQIEMILPVIGDPADAVPGLRDAAMNLLADGL